MRKITQANTIDIHSDIQRRKEQTRRYVYISIMFCQMKCLKALKKFNRMDQFIISINKLFYFLHVYLFLLLLLLNELVVDRNMCAVCACAYICVHLLCAKRTARRRSIDLGLQLKWTQKSNRIYMRMRSHALCVAHGHISNFYLILFICFVLTKKRICVSVVFVVF